MNCLSNVENKHIQSGKETNQKKGVSQKKEDHTSVEKSSWILMEKKVVKIFGEN